MSIKVENLTYSIQEGNQARKILNNISINIPKGKLTSITGESGSGKTTLLYGLSGILKIDEGNVFLNDKNLCNMKIKEREKFRLNHISFIYQQLNLFNFLNVEENIKINWLLRNKKISKDVDKQIDQYLELFNLGNSKKKEIQSLSGGEKQRIAIIRSFVSKSDFIFTDEPTGNLDTKNSLLFMESLQKIMKNSTRTVIMVTHDSKLCNYADEKINLIDGKINNHTII